MHTNTVSRVSAHTFRTNEERPSSARRPTAPSRPVVPALTETTVVVRGPGGGRDTNRAGRRRGPSQRRSAIRRRVGHNQQTGPATAGPRRRGRSSDPPTEDPDADLARQALPPRGDGRPPPGQPRTLLRGRGARPAVSHRGRRHREVRRPPRGRRL